MEDKNQIDEFSKVTRHPHEQMLKLVAKGFYKELIKYGIEEPEVLTVAGHLLDNVALKSNPNRVPLETYSGQLSIKDVQDDWSESASLSMGNVTISPIQEIDFKIAVEWMRRPEIKKYFYPQFPDTVENLGKYFELSNRAYFRISHENELVGIIGADQIDRESDKLEMRKLIGESSMRGKGIGKRATFLFLYYSFIIERFEKVFMHSLDINIRNLNLNGKFGFYIEGVFFEDAKIDDERHDLVRMALTRAVWEELFR